MIWISTFFLICQKRLEIKKKNEQKTFARREVCDEPVNEKSLRHRDP